MDILSHGLWGGIAFGRKTRRDYWWSFGFGIMPDLFSFGIFTLMRILGRASGPDFGNGLPDMSLIPSYVDSLYNITHSILIFSIVFGAVWFLRRKPFLPMLAWGLHILVDIPTHSLRGRNICRPIPGFTVPFQCSRSCIGFICSP